MVLIIPDIFDISNSFDSFDRPAEFYKSRIYQRPNCALFYNSSLVAQT